MNIHYTLHSTTQRTQNSIKLINCILILTSSLGGTVAHFGHPVCRNVMSVKLVKMANFFIFSQL